MVPLWVVRIPVRGRPLFCVALRDGTRCTYRVRRVPVERSIFLDERITLSPAEGIHYELSLCLYQLVVGKLERAPRPLLSRITVKVIFVFLFCGVAFDGTLDVFGRREHHI